jgi:YfiH family protein
MVLVADCVPILLYDPDTRAIAAIHAGWKGTLASIAEQTVRTMKMHFGSNPSDIIAGIGPSIGPCCFHVGPEVVSQARKEFGSTAACIVSTSARGGYLDLWQANQDQLLHAGLRKAHIEVAGICTAHHQNTFFSHRGEMGRTGRFAAGIYMETR